MISTNRAMSTSSSTTISRAALPVASGHPGAAAGSRLGGHSRRRRPRRPGRRPRRRRCRRRRRPPRPRRPPRSCRRDAAVDLDAQLQVAAVDWRARGADLLQHLRHELLAAEAGLDRHDQQRVELRQHLEVGLDQRVPVDRQAGQRTGRAQVPRHRHRVVGRLGVERDVVARRPRRSRAPTAPGRRSSGGSPAAGGRLAQALHHRQADGQVGHEMVVHHVHVQPVGAPRPPRLSASRAKSAARMLGATISDDSTTRSVYGPAVAPPRRTTARAEHRVRAVPVRPELHASAPRRDRAPRRQSVRASSSSTGALRRPPRHGHRASRPGAASTSRTRPPRRDGPRATPRRAAHAAAGSAAAGRSAAAASGPRAGGAARPARCTARPRAPGRSRPRAARRPADLAPVGGHDGHRQAARGLARPARRGARSTSTAVRCAPRCAASAPSRPALPPGPAHRSSQRSSRPSAAPRRARSRPAGCPRPARARGRRGSRR